MCVCVYICVGVCVLVYIYVYVCVYVCVGAHAAALYDLAEGHMGGQSAPSGPEHPAAPDGGLRHPLLQIGRAHV